MRRDDQQKRNTFETGHDQQGKQGVRRVAPGKATLTGKLPGSRSMVQREHSETRGVPSSNTQPPANRIDDLSIDLAHRGITALAESGQDELRPASDNGSRGEAAQGDTSRISMASAMSSMAGMADTAESVTGPPVSGALDVRGTARAVPFMDEMEAAFGADFSGVRAYLGEPEAFDCLDAEGMAAGDMVAFRSPTPDVAVVAHELTHVMQSRQSGTTGGQLLSRLSNPADPAEREARTVAAAVANGEPAPTVFERPAAEAQCSFISFAVKASAKQGTKAMLKRFIKQNIKDRLAQLLNKSLAKKYAREADEILEILEDPWWMTAIGFIPIVGDALDLARVPAQIRRAIARADEVEEAVSEALQQQRQIQRSINAYGARLAEHRASSTPIARIPMRSTIGES